MIVCVDVQYSGTSAKAAAVVFREWSDTRAASEHVTSIAGVAPYEPGNFYRRELPCVLEVLRMVRDPIDVVIIDGYVWLADQKPGLGAHLYDALEKRVPVIGVAKSRFAGATSALAVTRGDSSSPLFVSSAGMDTQAAVNAIRAMPGRFRIPTLLKRVDQLCRARN